MTERNTLAILTAAEAIAIVEHTNRWREDHYFTLMNHTLERIKELSVSGHRKYVVEAIGETVNESEFALALQDLGYGVIPGGKEYLTRTLIITW